MDKFQKTSKILKNWSAFLLKKPDPDIQVLTDFFTDFRLRPNRYVKPWIIIRIHSELFGYFSLFNASALLSFLKTAVQALLPQLCNFSK